MKDGELNDLSRSAAFLFENNQNPMFQTDEYLRWFYRENPNGKAIERYVDEEGTRIGHLAGIPQIYHCEGKELPVVFPLHILVAPQARGRGLMTKLSEQCFEVAQKERGVVGFIGMPNANSTPGYTGRLRFRLIRPLPVKVCLPINPAGVRIRTMPIDSHFLASEEGSELLRSIDYSPGPRWSQKWSPELLRWRLAQPRTHYCLHVGEGLVGVSCKTRRFGLSFAVILKMFRRSSGMRTSASSIVTAACICHRTVAAIYAGFNATVRVFGIPLPERLKPAPLNLIFRSLDEQVVRQDEFEAETMEFLDFDAY